MVHPHPERLALAAMAWGKLERLLTEQGQALTDIERKRADYVRVLVDCWDTVPEPVQIVQIVQTVQAEEPPPPRVEVPIDAAPIGVVGRAVWYARTDPIAWGHEPPTPRSGPGFTCRRCGARVRRARHVDPRLICLRCLASG